MSLTDQQLFSLARKMQIPLEGVCFKDKLDEYDFEYNKAFIVNLSNSVDENGHPASGTHWVCFAIVKHLNGVKQGFYFDSFGIPEPKEITEFVKGHFPHQLPYNNKDIQCQLNNACGWYCLAILHFIFACPYAGSDLYSSVETFLSMFKNLYDEPQEWKYNEWVLKHFFQSTNEDDRKRNPINVFEGLKFIPTDTGNIANPETITSQDEKGSII